MQGGMAVSAKPGANTLPASEEVRCASGRSGTHVRVFARSDTRRDAALAPGCGRCGALAHIKL
jgi:hypothetical protein